MTETLAPAFLTTAFALATYVITFGIYKRPRMSEATVPWRILFVAYVVINLIIAARTLFHHKALIIDALCLLNVFVYPVFSSSVLVNIAPAKSPIRTFIIILGILSCPAFIIAFSLLFKGNN